MTFTMIFSSSMALADVFAVDGRARNNVCVRMHPRACLPGTDPDNYLRRVTVHFVVINIICAWMRWSIEDRERELFTSRRRTCAGTSTPGARGRHPGRKGADATKAKFLAHMSHEIRTPMSGVLQILELIGARVSDADRDLIEKGRKAGHALLRILNGVLDYAKLSQQW
jgi:signal transduction histidine kinase